MNEFKRYQCTCAECSDMFGSDNKYSVCCGDCADEEIKRLTALLEQKLTAREDGLICGALTSIIENQLISYEYIPELKIIIDKLESTPTKGGGK